MKSLPNKPVSVNPAMALWLTTEAPRRRVADRSRCYRTQLLTMLLALLPVLAQAKHVNPPAVPAITNSGVRYVVPNDKGLHAYVEAWSITTGQKLWTKKIFTHWYIPPFGTECMHYEWIKSMAMLEDDLVLTSERGRIYKLNIHTRSVRRAKTPNPATSGA